VLGGSAFGRPISAASGGLTFSAARFAGRFVVASRLTAEHPLGAEGTAEHVGF
jgi:hypothetical protein